MIHWSWIVIAFLSGAMTGVFAIALCLAAKSGDEQPTP